MKADLIYSREIESYPSGSTISYRDKRFYLMGDDAASLSILDTTLHIVDTLPLFTYASRINKPDKADIEASEWIDGILWLFGSGSLSPQRDRAFCFNPQNRTLEVKSMRNFYEKLRQSRIPGLNIEACAQIDNQLLFGSRGNIGNGKNFIIQCSVSGFPDSAVPVISFLNLPDSAGISGMAYIAEHDLLLLTASKEDTKNAYDDGNIGESYLGAIYKASRKLPEADFTPDEWLQLSTIHTDLRKQKIESVCTFSTASDSLDVLLVTDNDDGKTKLFGLKLNLEH